MEWLQSLSVDQLDWIFIGFAILLALVVWLASQRRRDDDAQAVALMIDWFDIRGIGTIFQLLVLLSVFGLAWVGWRIPAEIEQLHVNQDFLHGAFPHAGSELGRLAQVVGAFCFAVVGFRSLRYVVPIMVFFLGVFGVYLAYQYVGYGA